VAGRSLLLLLLPLRQMLVARVSLFLGEQVVMAAGRRRRAAAASTIFGAASTPVAAARVIISARRSSSSAGLWRYGGDAAPVRINTLAEICLR